MSITKQEQCDWYDECYRMAVNVMFTKMSAKQVIKHFKELDVASIVKEYKQLNDTNTFGRVCLEDMIPKQKRDTLHAITLIKEKRSGKIKGG